MNKENLSFGFMLLSILILWVVIVFKISAIASCPVAEVYMTGNIQEDDLFIPANSIGKVDLKR